MFITETHSDLISFLNKYLPKEIAEIVCVTTIKHSVTNENNHNWEVELVCKKNTIDECLQFKLLYETQKHINVFNGSCDNVNIKVCYLTT
jgi:hypothetical protein